MEVSAMIPTGSPDHAVTDCESKVELLLERAPLDKAVPVTSVDLKSFSGTGSSSELIH